MTNNSKLSAWPSMLSPPFLGQGASDEAANPLAQSLSSGMDFMKNMWGQMPSGVPGFVVPTVDLEELDKRIADLKAVEGWLELNANMLKATIQGLQVQRSTVAALKAMGQQGGGLNQMMQDLQRNQSGATAASAAGRAGTSAATGHASPNANWPMQEPADAFDEPPPDPDEPPKESPRPASRKAAPASPRSSAKKAAAPADPVNAAALASANIWMNFLKDQFSQIAGAAVRSGEVAAKPPVTTAPKSPAARSGKKSGPKASTKKRAKRQTAAKRVLAPRR